MRKTEGYLFRRGGKYWVGWTFDGVKHRQTTGTGVLRDAKTKATEILAPFRQAAKVDTLAQLQSRVDRERVTLTELDNAAHPPLLIANAWSTFMAHPSRPDSGPATLRQYESEFDRFRTWLAEQLPDAVSMCSVTEKTAAAYAQHLTASKASPSTFNQHIGFLRLLWRLLKKEVRMPDGNPWDSVNRRHLVGTSRRELTLEELRTVCAASNGELRALFGLGIYTGMRLGDCATLRWGEVDLLRGVIRRVPMKTSRRKTIPVLIPVHATLRSILETIPRPKGTDFVLPESAERYLTQGPSALSRQIQSHLEACGVRTVKPGTGYITQPDKNGRPRRVFTGKRAVVEAGFHSLRHTFVSLCRGANAPLAVVEAIVGHASPAMTRHYTHVGLTAAGAAVAALPSVMGPVPSTDEKPKELVEAGPIRKLVQTLTPKNSTEVRRKLLLLLAGGQ